MGRNAWESDADLQKIGSSFRSGSTARWGRVFVWIVIVAAATFAFAYYLPLHQTHRAVIEQRRQTQEVARTLEQKLHETEQQLGVAKKQNQELTLQRESRDQSQKSAVGRAELLKKTLAGKLGTKASVGVDGARVLVAIESRVLLAPPKHEVSTAGRGLLCSIAAASERHPLSVSAMTEKTLPAGASSSWALTGAQAAAVAQTLEEKCAVAPARLTAMGRGSNPGPAGAFAGTQLPENRVEIAIDTGAAPQR